MGVNSFLIRLLFRREIISQKHGELNRYPEKFRRSAAGKENRKK